MILKVYSNNNFLFDFTLEENTEYIIGRHQDCDIHLDVENGISRKHLAITLSDNKLVVTLLSAMGELKYQGENCKEINVQLSESFSIDHFHFELANQNTQEEYNSEYNKNLENIDEGATVQLKPDLVQEKALEEYSDLPINNDENAFALDNNSSDSQNEYDQSNNEKDKNAFNCSDVDDQPDFDEQTATGLHRFTILLHILSNSTDAIKRSYELEGESWIIGRDEKSSLQLPYPFVSRKHFEMKLTNEGLFIGDLGSGNGTLLNGKKLPPNKSIRIYSDDIIEIKRLKIKIEVISQDYQNIVYDESFESSYQNINDFQNKDDYESLLPTDPYSKPSKNNSKQLIIRVLILALVIGAVYFKLGPQNQKKKPAKRTVAQKTVKKETNANQVIIMDIYSLAKNFFKNQEHLSCITELERLHELTPEYKDSKQLLASCKNSLAIQEEIESKRVRDQQARKIKDNINTIAVSCRTQFNNFKNKQELNSCLDQLLILSPDHPVISELTSRWDANVQQEELNKTQHAEKERKIKVAKALYNNAKFKQDAGELNEAVKLYEKYINNQYADKTKKSDSEREVASLRKEIINIKTEFIANCKNSSDNGNLKETVTQCTKVLKKYPNNPEVLELRDQALGQLRKKAKELFLDGNLEESLGNISAAKDKWKEILDFHVKSDEYYKKAKRKLKKYNDF